jgi:Spy/CpxP family protein refolding chaperone
MRRLLTAMAAAATLVGAATLAPTPAPAASAAAAPFAAPQSLHPVQFYGAGPHYGDHGWERRRQWREWRRERDEARIAEAARREAWRIEQEREQRRAWRRAMREQHYGYGPAYGYGHHRGW